MERQEKKDLENYEGNRNYKHDFSSYDMTKMSI